MWIDSMWIDSTGGAKMTSSAVTSSSRAVASSCQTIVLLVSVILSLLTVAPCNASASTTTVTTTTTTATTSNSLSTTESEALTGLVLDEAFMTMTDHAARLSHVVYESSGLSTAVEEGYDLYEEFVDEPNKGAVAMKDGYCYLAFRGTTPNRDDWYENLEPGFQRVCVHDECCEVRLGYYEAVFDNYRFEDMVKRLDECVRSDLSVCSQTDTMNCVVITGHSQGAAAANVAALYFSYYNPIVIGFGTPAAVKYPCAPIQEDRWFLYINTISDPQAGMLVDSVPLLPTYGATFYGHTIVLSGQDVTAVAYLGLADPSHPFNLVDEDAYDVSQAQAENASWDAHSLSLYKQHFEDFLYYGVFPIPTTGFPNPHPCTVSELCRSARCDPTPDYPYDVCVDKVGSCMYCDEHSDCISATCLATMECTNPETDLVENGCACYNSLSCESGNCDYHTETCVA